MSDTRDRLTTSEYWESIPYTTSSESWIRAVPLSFFDSHLISLLRPHVRPGHKLLELGVAPGLHVLRLAKKLGLEPFGLDYSVGGVQRTRGNFAAAGLDPGNVLHFDIMSESIDHSLTNRFDTVFSNGLIEHFLDVRTPIARHVQFARVGGVVIISVPNLVHVRSLVPVDVQAIHNFAVMNPDALTAALPPNVELISAGYFGGIADLGLFVARHPFVNTARIGAYCIQRLTLDIAQRALLRLGIDFSNKWLSPGIYVLARKIRA